MEVTPISRSAATWRCCRYDVARIGAVGLDTGWLRRNRVVPVDQTDETITVALESPDDASILREVQRQSGRRPIPVAATPEEIEDALTRLEGNDSPARSAQVRLTPAVHLFGLSRPPQLDEAYGSAADVIRDLIEPGGMDEHDLAAACALAYGVPLLPSNAALPLPGFDSLVSANVAARHLVVPAAFVAGHVLLACAVPPPPDLLAAIERDSGFVVHPLIAPLSAVRGALRGSERAAPTERVKGPGQEPGRSSTASTARVLDRAVALRLLSPKALARAGLVAAQTREPLDLVVVRLGLLDRRDLDRLTWEEMDVETLDAGRLRGDPVLLEAVPVELARRLVALPLSVQRGGARVAFADPASTSAVELLRVVLGRPIVRVRADEVDLRRAIEDAYSRIPEEPRRELSETQAHAAFGAAIDPRDARAIALGVPRVDLGRLHLDPALAAQVPEDVARAQRIVPLWTTGRVLVAAVPDWPVPEAAAALRQEGRLYLRPALADGGAIDLALDDVYAIRSNTLSSRYLELEPRLVREFQVPQARLVEARRRITRFGEPVDLALVRAGVLGSDQVALALAKFRGLRTESITPREQRESAFDPLGRRVTHMGTVDPVDPGVARLLDESLAREWCALPIRRSRNGIHVVVADPLGNALEDVQRTLRQRVFGAVAPRAEIEDALRRLFGERIRRERGPALGDRLLAADLITSEQLQRGLALARQTGVRLGTALVSLDVLSQDQLYTFLADQLGIPFFDVDPTLIAPEAMALLPEELEREWLVLPLAFDETTVTVATVDALDPATLAEIARRANRQVRQVLTTEADVRRCLDAFYGQYYLERAASELMSRSPDDSAHRVLSERQQRTLIGLLLVSAVLLAVDYVLFLQVLTAVFTTFMVSLSAYKLFLIQRAVTHSLEIRLPEAEVEALDERTLPVYTILVPMYYEAEVLDSLVAGLDRLDYPKAKLDVKLLLEADDHETIAAARRMKLPAHFQLVVVPHGLPKGKPKACNYGLIHAKGEFVVIYDAEDAPDPDQLKKAVLAFRKGDASLACVQAKLNYFNRDQNLLTRWFTAEYSMWFDLLLPGLDATEAPIPLGGTSNHFRTAQLRELGSWDPFNVTEDADLGLRIFARGWKTAVIDSTTYEEANSALFNWIRQRSRWVKGYIQTWLVRMRHPVALWKALGPFGFISFQLFVGGTFFAFLVNPLYWALTALWFLTRWGLIDQLFPGVVFVLGAIGLFVGNFVFVCINVLGCLRREYYEMVKYALLSPIYWALMSVAAWKGFLQLFYKPFYWEKTRHGLAKGSPAALAVEGGR